MKHSCFSAYSHLSTHAAPKVASATIALLLGAFLAVPAYSQSTQPRTSCESLSKLALPDTTITLAQLVHTGEFKQPPHAPPPRMGNGGPGRPGGPGGPGGSGGMRNIWNPPIHAETLPDFCRIAATLRPTSDSDIHIEVWLPQSTWNGKFVGVGGGGMAGNITYTGLPIGLADALRESYATANTDAGHDASKDASDGIFLLHHPEKMIDFSYRANHEMTVKAKALIAAYYGKAPSHSYFIGCSLGSLQALNEAKRYPEDYDGVVAGAPMSYLGDFNAAQLWPSVLIAKDPAKLIPRAKYQMIHEAAVKACATPIGLKQGFIDDPENCHFDPGSLLCKNGDQPTCLTAPQVEFMRQVYRGPVNPRTGKLIFMGPPPGAEGQLTMYADGGAHPSSVAIYRYEIEQDPNWDWKNMSFDTDVAKADKVLGPLMYVTPESLVPFLNGGGKLMLYIGWEDYHNPKETAAYYEQLRKDAGPGKADDIRLFEVLGMGHCAGGEGCDTFDKIAAINQWVTSGKAPDQIVSSKLDNDDKVIRTRPICAYPMVSKYKGTGSIDDAESFICTKPW